MNQELDIAEKLINEGFTSFGDINELTEDDLISNDDIFEYIFSIDDNLSREKIIAKLQIRAKKLKVLRIFNNLYKAYEEKNKIPRKNIENNNVIPYISELNFGKYEIGSNGEIIEDTSNGPIIVCYHPIFPIGKYINVQTGTEKIELAYYFVSKNKDGEKEFNKKTIIVNKSTIASPQSIIKLSDNGISVTSENAKYLIKYLAEMEHLNKDKIPTNKSTSKLGWIEDKLAPYNNDIVFDREQDFYGYNEVFKEKGTLEEWVNFFKERRKFSAVARTTMAVSVSSILLKKMGTAGFVFHLWTTSDYGKTAAMVAAESIFGKPSIQGEPEGIGITADASDIGLQNKLNMYNNIPVFMNELSESIKTKKRIDPEWLNRMMYLVELGIGRTRATRDGGLIAQQTWLLNLITSAETDIHLTDTDDEGAYNRCLSWKLESLSYENASENYYFCRENYGTAIREFLKHIDEYDVKQIFDENLNNIKQKNYKISDKPMRMVSAILTADKVFTDIIFKDGFYLTCDEILNHVSKKDESSIGIRAYNDVISWYVKNKGNFLNKDNEKENKNAPVFGKELSGPNDGFVAFRVPELRDFLEQTSRGGKNSYNFKQVLNEWNKSGWTKVDKGKTQKNVIIDKVCTKCIVLDIHAMDSIENDLDDIESMEYDPDILPF